jgi:hypothetical protein
MLCSFTKRLGIKLENETMLNYEKHLLAKNSKFTKTKNNDNLKHSLISDPVVLFVTLACGYAYGSGRLVWMALLLLQSGNIVNLYFDLIIGALIEGASYIILYFALAKIARKPLIHILTGMLLVIILVAVILRAVGSKLPLATDLSTAAEAFDISGRLCSGTLTIVIWNYYTQLFPLNVQSQGFTLIGIVGKVGQIIAPFVIVKKLSKDLWFIHYIIFLFILVSLMFLVSCSAEMKDYSVPLTKKDLEASDRDPQRLSAVFRRMKMRTIAALDRLYCRKASKCNEDKSMPHKDRH